MSQYLLSSAGMVQPTRIVGSWAAAEKDALTMTARTVNKHLPIASVPLAGPARTQALPDAPQTLAKIPAGVASIVGVLGARFFLFCKPSFAHLAPALGAPGWPQAPETCGRHGASARRRRKRLRRRLLSGVRGNYAFFRDRLARA